MPEPAARRAFATALSLGLGGGLLALLGTSRPWAEVDAAGPGMPASLVQVSGGSALPWLPALALVVCSSWLAVLATSGLPRRAVGLLSLLAALALVAGAAGAEGAVREAVADAVRASPTSAQGSAPVLAERATRSAWPLLTATGGLLAALAAAAVLARGHQWPAMGRRYRSPATAPARPKPGNGASPTGSTSDPVDWWQALDEGRDPTS